MILLRHNGPDSLACDGNHLDVAVVVDSPASTANHLDVAVVVVAATRLKRMSVASFSSGPCVGSVAVLANIANLQSLESVTDVSSVAVIGPTSMFLVFSAVLRIACSDVHRCSVVRLLYQSLARAEFVLSSSPLNRDNGFLLLSRPLSGGVQWL